MKTLIFLTLLAFRMVSPAQTIAPGVDSTAQPADELVSKTAPAVTSAGQHWRVWAWTNQIRGVDGLTRDEPHSYQELCENANYWDANQGAWLPTEERVELTADGAAALHGPHKLVCGNTLATPITLYLPDGQRMVTQIRGLAYVSRSTGQGHLIASLKSSTGEIRLPNVVAFPDTFEGVSNVSVVLTYSRRGFEQDLHLDAHSDLPEPESLGLDPEDVVLQVWTEVLESPAPALQPSIPGTGVGTTLDFGSMRIGQGRAFTLPDIGQQPGISVTPQWLDQDAARYIIESAPYPAVLKALATLPQASVPAKQRTARLADARPRAGPILRQFPPRPGKPAGQAVRPMRLVASPPHTQGLVIDYQILTSGLTNWVFAGSTNYLIVGTVTLGGTNTVWEGGCVIKTTNGASLVVQSTNVDFQGTQYHPVVFTSMHDSSLGEPITGSTGNPTTNLYGNPVLRLATGGTNVVQNLRIRYANTALELAGANNTISHLQLLRVRTGIRATNSNPVQVALRNVLAAEMDTLLSGTNLTASVEHLTLARANFLGSTSAAPTICLTNSLLVAVTNASGYSSNCTQLVPSISGVFQTVGAGQYYLPATSPYLACGTTNISPDLLRGLALRTTYAPVGISNVTYTVNTTLGPTAPRGGGTPALGYYYDPLDYVMTKVTVNGVTVILTNGACIGIDYTGWSSYGIASGQAYAYSTFVSQGSPFVLNRIVQTHSVQEQPSASGNYMFNDLLTGTCPYPYAVFRFRYTDLAQMAGANYYLCGGTNLTALELSRSRVRGGIISLGGGRYYYPPTHAWTDTLFERSSEVIASWGLSVVNVTLRNNLLWRGAFSLGAGPTNLNSSIQNNVFDNVNLSAPTSVNSYNGYINTPVLPGSSGNDVTNSTFTYQIGPLGRYYQPTNSVFIDKGNTSAANLSLYHFCTTTNQAKETSSVVDIGLHYVAADVNGQPLDSDGDGIHDYIEDANGNGVIESGETRWDDATDVGLWVRIRRPSPGNPIP